MKIQQPLFISMLGLLLTITTGVKENMPNSKEKMPNSKENMPNSNTAKISTAMNNEDPVSQSKAPDETTVGSGLSSSQAAAVLARDGPNAMPDTSGHLLRSALSKF